MRIPTVEELTRGVSEAEARQHIRDIERLVDMVFALRKEREAFQDASMPPKVVKARLDMDLSTFSGHMVNLREVLTHAAPGMDRIDELEQACDAHAATANEFSDRHRESAGLAVRRQTVLDECKRSLDAAGVPDDAPLPMRIDALAKQLAAVSAARDEACDLYDEIGAGTVEDDAKIVELRKVGQP